MRDVENLLGCCYLVIILIFVLAVVSWVPILWERCCIQ
jgi:hypothetical protein